MTTNVFAPEGVCQFCGCTEENACRLTTGETCCWMGRRRNCCCNPVCITSWHDGLRELAPKKRTPADINELIRRRGRDRKKVRA